MKTKTNVKAGALAANHNESQVRDTKQAAGLRIKTNIKAGALADNHNETQVRDTKQAKGLRIKTLFVTGMAALLALPVLAQSQNPNDPNPGVVLTPNSAPGGLTYGEWSAKWFKWAYEPPPASSPVLDTTGQNCAVGQSGDVWFLAGTFFISPPAPPPVTRICTIPAGRRLFFPVGNAFCA